jgi:hypothetical protein
VPNVAVTLGSFASAEQAGLADPERAVWVIDDGPRGGTTAYVNTWALGPLSPGQTKRFVWRVTAVQAGTHTVKWQVAAGLNGKAKATLSGNRAPAGSFTVDVSAKPAQARATRRPARSSARRAEHRRPELRRPEQHHRGGAVRACGGSPGASANCVGLGSVPGTDPTQFAASAGAGGRPPPR